MKTEREITVVQLPYHKNKKSHRFVLNHQNPKPDLYEVNSNSDRRPTGNNVAYFPNSFSFLCEDNVYDASTQSMRIIRYVKGEASIFADEQSSNEFLKTERIEFNGKHYGVLTVPKENTQLLQFLAMTDYNAAKEGRDTTKRALFRHVDEIAIYENQLETEILTDKAKSLALNCNHDEMMSLAMGMEPPVKIDGREEKAIRWDLLQRAKANPQGFIDTVNDPITSKKATLRKAEDMGIIKRTNNSLSWANNQAFLIVPTGQNPYSFFCAQKGMEIESVYDSICSMLEAAQNKKKGVTMPAAKFVNPTPVVVEEVMASAGKTGVVNNPAFSQEVQDAYADAVKKGIFQKSPNAKMLTKWETYDSKYAARKAWLERLSSDEELLEKLQVEIASK